MDADVIITLRWREPGLDGIVLQEKQDLAKYWSPDIRIYNAYDEPTEKSNQKSVVTETGQIWVEETRTISVSLRQNLDLRQFPFDKQTLSLHLWSPCELNDLDFTEDTSFVSGVCLSHVRDYRCFEHLEFANKSVKNRVTGREYPGMEVTTTATRHCAFWLVNYFLVMVLLCAMLPLPWAFDPNTLAHFRTNMAYTFATAILVFKFAAQSMFPEVGYMNLLDGYMLASILTNMMMAFWHAACTLIADPDERYSMDRMQLALMGGVSIAFHVVLFTAFYIVWYRNRIFAKRKEEAYLTKKARIQGASKENPQKA